MHISKRLQTVAGLVSKGSILADIGTDHAYVPIYLMEQGSIAHAIAMDVNEGPLQKADEHIQMFHMQDKIETRLSDGLAKLEVGEAESIIIAGMGGALTIRILTDGKAKWQACKELILQPQSEVAAVRNYLQSEGFGIVEEEMVEEDGKYYPMMKAVPHLSMQLSENEAAYGPVLLKKHHPVLLAYLQKEENTNRKILESLQKNASADVSERICEVEKKLAQIAEILGSWD